MRWHGCRPRWVWVESATDCGPLANRVAIEKASRWQPLNDACSSVATNGPRRNKVKRFTTPPKEMNDEASADIGVCIRGGE
jgi:hypothetical protein